MNSVIQKNEYLFKLMAFTTCQDCDARSYTDDMILKKLHKPKNSAIEDSVEEISSLVFAEKEFQYQ